MLAASPKSTAIADLPSLLPSIADLGPQFDDIVGPTPSNGGEEIAPEKLNSSVISDNVSLAFFSKGLSHCNVSAFTVEEKTPGTTAYKLKRADCGLGYTPPKPDRKVHWQVVLYGSFEVSWTRDIVDLAGFPLGAGRCPFSRKCTIIYSRDKSVLEASDVAVFHQSEYHLVNDLHPPAVFNHSKPFRVVYWREAVFRPVPPAVQRKLFDFEMGVHRFSGILNPNFFFAPSTMMASDLPSMGNPPFLPFNARTAFALSIISDCEASSYRREYIAHLVSILGPRRVHQYGRCGDRELPPKPITHAANIVARYKFYFAFENTIMNGYTTEKLIFGLMMNVVPVYYGALDAPNITKTPSYIRASDFRSAHALAQYLLYLDAHPEEYMKYHAWRKDPSLFDDSFLEFVAKKVPGPFEISRYMHFPRPPRTAACCRLCDEEYVRRLKLERKDDDVVNDRWKEAQINKRFFAGKIRYARDFLAAG